MQIGIGLEKLSDPDTSESSETSSSEYEGGATREVLNYWLYNLYDGSKVSDKEPDGKQYTDY